MMESRFLFRYAIDNGAETLVVKEFDSYVVIDRKYNHGYCLIDLVFEQRIVPISNETRQRVERFKKAYQKYYQTGNDDLISDIIIHAGTKRMTIGRIPKVIMMILETSDIDKLVDFIMVQVYKNKLMLTY